MFGSPRGRGVCFGSSARLEETTGHMLMTNGKKTGSTCYQGERILDVSAGCAVIHHLVFFLVTRKLDPRRPLGLNQTNEYGTSLTSPSAEASFTTCYKR
jgi:hypothetical protein